jgi:hypothetical protein
MGSLTAVNTLAAFITEIVGRVEFSLAGGAFPPKLRCVLSMQLQETLIEKCQISIYHLLRLETMETLICGFLSLDLR